jgi:hypothetical protein
MNMADLSLAPPGERVTGYRAAYAPGVNGAKLQILTASGAYSPPNINLSTIATALVFLNNPNCYYDAQAGVFYV